MNEVDVEKKSPEESPKKIENVLAVDLECDGLKPSTIHCIVIMDMITGEIERYNHELNGNLRDDLDRLSKADVVIGHNISDFDLQVIHRLYPGWTTRWYVPG